MTSQVPDGARGLCPVCNRMMRLNRDGTLRHHGGPVGSGLAWRRAYRCDGAGELPSAEYPSTPLKDLP